MRAAVSRGLRATSLLHAVLVILVARTDEVRSWSAQAHEATEMGIYSVHFFRILSRPLKLK
jgi:hypothetical protein